MSEDSPRQPSPVPPDEGTSKTAARVAALERRTKRLEAERLAADAEVYAAENFGKGAPTPESVERLSAAAGWFAPLKTVLDEVFDADRMKALETALKKQGVSKPVFLVGRVVNDFYSGQYTANAVWGYACELAPLYTTTDFVGTSDAPPQGLALEHPEAERRLRGAYEVAYRQFLEADALVTVRGRTVWEFLELRLDIYARKFWYRLGDAKVDDARAELEARIDRLAKRGFLKGLRSVDNDGLGRNRTYGIDRPRAWPKLLVLAIGNTACDMWAARYWRSRNAPFEEIEHGGSFEPEETDWDFDTDRASEAVEQQRKDVEATARKALDTLINRFNHADGKGAIKTLALLRARLRAVVAKGSATGADIVAFAALDGYKTNQSSVSKVRSRAWETYKEVSSELGQAEQKCLVRLLSSSVGALQS